MASLQERKRKDGRAYLIQFTLNRERRSVFLDIKYTRDEAEAVKLVVEKCVDAIETETNVDKRTLAWLENAPDDLRSRFIAAGLIEEEIDGSMTLDELFQAFFREQERVLKPNTVKSYLMAERVFFERVDSKTTVAEFRRADALKFAADLAATHYAKASRAAFIKSVKVVFNWALDREIIGKNPFGRISEGGTVNKSREFYVDREMFAKLLDACASPEERVLLALYRVAGLRSSEALLLTWGNVDFEASRLIVLSPKTERIDGKEKRVAPLFPQLRRELIAFRDALGAQALDKESRIISRNQRYPWSTIKRVLARANLPPYPRLVQNLRSSASIDIYSRYGEVAESAWLGHTLSTAQKHYLHVLESDYEKATLED